MEAYQASAGGSASSSRAAAVSTDAVVTHPCSFTLLPLKAANQPGNQPQLAQQQTAADSYSPLKGARANASIGQGNTPTAVQAYLHQLSAARSIAMGLLSDPRSAAGAVQTAVNSYLSMLLDLASEAAAQTSTSQQQQEQQQQELGELAEGAGAACHQTQLAAPTEQQQGGSLHSYLLRRALAFDWFDVLLPFIRSPGKQRAAEPAVPVPCWDVLHEAANLLLADATWHMVKAAALVNATAGQTDSATAMEAYKWQRTAAGMLHVVQRELLPQLVGWLGADLQGQLLAGLHSFALAEAQSLTLQRALAKSHQPPLISSIATDTASLYSSALQNIQAAAAAAAQQPGSSPIAAAVHAEVTSGAAFERLFSSPLPNLRWGASGRHVPKLLKYCQYQVCYCYAVAAVHSADASLAGSEAGTAVAWAQEASRAVKHVYSIGAEYDRLQPATSREQRQQLERTLDSKVQATLAKCTRDNATVYYQSVPKQLPPLPAAKRAVEPLPFTLPPAAQQLSQALAAQLVAAVSGKQQPGATSGAAAHASAGATAAMSGSGCSPAHANGAAAGAGSAAGATGADESKTAAAADNSGARGCSCWRVLVLVVCYPLLILVSLVGILVWLLLLPFKLCCCCLPCACAVQLMWNVVEYAIKAPLNGAIWAAGAGRAASSAAAASSKERKEKQSMGDTASAAGGHRDIEAP